MQEAIKRVQDRILKLHGIKTEAHYVKGVGAAFVPAGFNLAPHQVVTSLSEIELGLVTTLKLF